MSQKTPPPPLFSPSLFSLSFLPRSYRVGPRTAPFNKPISTCAVFFSLVECDLGWPGRALATTLYSVPGLTPVPLTCVGMPLPGPRTFHLPSLPGDLSSQLVTAGLTRAQREALGKLALFEGYVRELSGVHLLTCGMPYMMQRLFLLNVYVPRTAHHVPWTVYHAPHRAQATGRRVLGNMCAGGCGER